MHDEPVVPASRMPAHPADRGATRHHLRLIVGGTAPQEQAMHPLEAGELRRVTGGPLRGPAPRLSPAVEPW